MISREIRMKRRPTGMPTEDDFALVAVDLPEPADGEVLVRNVWMSVDPYMRLPMTGLEGHHRPVAEGSTMEGGAVGVIVRSRHPSFPEGVHVLHPKNGWREAYLSTGDRLSRLDPAEAPLSCHLGILGLTGVSAYCGMEYVLSPVRGETVFVSGAAGAVGSVACQLAKHRGCTVIGSAGSEEKLRWLRDELGVDHVINHRTQELTAALRDAAPDGIDVSFDNVGGATLEAMISSAKVKSRIGLCGAIAQYNDANYRSGPRNFFAVIEKGLVLKGMSSALYRDRQAETVRDLGARLESGRLIARETVVNGIENAVEAFRQVMSGGNIGKMLVRIEGPR